MKMVKHKRKLNGHMLKVDRKTKKKKKIERNKMKIELNKKKNTECVGGEIVY